MKRPVSWPLWVLVLLVLALGAEHALFSWIAPRYVLYLFRAATDGSVAIQSAHLEFPFTTALNQLRWVGNSDEAALTAERMLIRPRWVSFRRREIWLRSVTFEDAFLRLTRRPDGTMALPVVQVSPPHGVVPGTPGAAAWTVHVETVKIESGIFEIQDARISRPFHGTIQHIAFVMGPFTMPRADAQTSFALRALAVGDAGHSAPFYCSGGFNAYAKDLQAACRLEPLPLAAFDPYYPSGRIKVRVYDATVSSTSLWQAHANALQGNIQLKMQNLSEGDLSVMGRTILNVPAVTGGQEVSGAVALTGPLDSPGQWEAHFVPGDQRVEQLLEPLLEHGIQFIRVPFVAVNITQPATQDAATEIQKDSQRVEKDLEILATPPAVPPTVELPPTEAADSGRGSPDAAGRGMTAVTETAAPAAPAPAVSESAPASVAPGP